MASAKCWRSTSTAGPIIRAADIREALLPAPSTGDGLLDRPLGDDFDLQELLGGVARHYLERALAEANGNKSRAAALLGFNNHQTFANWLRRHAN